MFQVLEPNEIMRRLDNVELCLLQQGKSVYSPTMTGLYGDLALHNLKIAQEKMKVLVAGLNGLVFTCEANNELLTANTEKEEAPLCPLEK